VELKYYFDEEGVFAPFVTLGAIAEKTVQKQFKYNYLPIAKGESHYSIRPNVGKVADNFAISTVTGSIGTDISLKKLGWNNWGVTAALSVNVAIENEAVASVLGIGGVGLTYSF
jgi:hypothetical protein